MEFSEWLYYNQFPLDDVIKHLDWAINILLHMKFATKPLEEGGVYQSFDIIYLE